MPTISEPPVGAIAYGRSGVPCIVTALESERVVLRCPDGASLRVPLTAIARWELPPELVSELAKAPVKVLAVGDHVLINSINATGIVAQLDNQYQEARVNDIEGYFHPEMGYQVLSQWFSYCCLQTIQKGRALA
jgi:hypothetical protein